MKPKTSLHIVENFLGEGFPIVEGDNFNPVVELFSKLSFEQKKQLSENLEEYGVNSWKEQSSIVDTTKGYKAFQEFNISGLLSTQDIVQSMKENLMKQLLYFPKLVLLDFGTHFDLNKKNDLLIATLWFSFLKQIEELTDKNIVLLIPETITGYHLSSHIPNETVLGEGRKLVIEHAKDLPSLSEHPLFSQTSQHIDLHTLFWNNFSQSGADHAFIEGLNTDQLYYLTLIYSNAALFEVTNEIDANPAFTDLFSWEVAHLSLRKSADQIKQQNKLDTIAAIKLAEVNVPNLHSLTVSDYIKIRKNEEAFDQWRRAFGKALELPLNVEDNQGFDLNYIRSREINDVLTDEAEKLKSGIRASSLKPLLVQFTSTLMIGGATAFANNPKLLPGVAAGAVAGFISSLLFQRKQKEKAALKFYSLFKQ